MWFRRLLPVLLGIAAGLFDLSITPWLPGPLAAMTGTLPLVVLLALFSSPKRALIGAVFAGITVDALLPTASFATLRALAVVGSILLVSRIYLTNRTLVGSLALGLVGLAADRLALMVLAAVRGFSRTPFIPELAPPWFPSLIWLELCVGIAFFVFAAFTRRFLPLVPTRR